MPTIPIVFEPKGVDKTKKAFGGVTSTAMKMAKVLGPLLLAGGVAKLGKTAITTAGQFEALKTRLQAMTGSIQQAEKLFNNFNKVAATTPFAVANVVEAGVNLKAFGLNAEESIKPVADLAAFMGVDIVDAAGAMGRAFAGGAGAADILRERGILQLIKDSEGIEDLSKLTLPEFREALVNAMTDPDGMIAGATDLLATTWQGKLSNMQDAWSRLMAAVGDKILPFAKDLASKVTEGLNNAIAFMDKVNWEETLNYENFQILLTRLGDTLYNVFGILFDGVKPLAKSAFVGVASVILDTFKSLFGDLFARFQAFDATLGQVIVIQFKTLGINIKNFFIDIFNNIKSQANKVLGAVGIDLEMTDKIDPTASLEPNYARIREIQTELDKILNPDPTTVADNYSSMGEQIRAELASLTEGLIVFNENKAEADEQTKEIEDNKLEEDKARHKTRKELLAEMTEEKWKQVEQGRKQMVADLDLIAEMQPKAKKLAKAAKIADLMISVPKSVQDAYNSGLAVPAPYPIPQGIAVAQAAVAAAAGAAQIQKVKQAATGYSGQVTQPTLFLAGERGAENVNITPLDSPNIRGPQESGQNVSVNFTGNVMSEDFIVEQAIPMIQDAIRRGDSLE